MPKITFQLPIRHPKTLLDLHFECRNVSITADCGTLEGGGREGGMCSEAEQCWWRA